LVVSRTGGVQELGIDTRSIVFLLDQLELHLSAVGQRHRDRDLTRVAAIGRSDRNAAHDEERADTQVDPGAERCIEILEKSGPAGEPWLAGRYAEIAEYQVTWGDAAAAITNAQKSFALMKKRGDATPAEIGETNFVLARALWNGGGHKKQARALTSEALEFRFAVRVAEYDLVPGAREKSPELAAHEA
jgi:hypothetical protein